ncbi:thiopeptide-type bacteriocin biosynthesis protein [uncultured Tenacibaculum sp.]|uniref:thiopeptide-type bacteriocin biosynthesis protein n=1 Tax=uncultured Tenacibaculum sp. TaxID=174713 RepID=UPI002611984F|nr:thiopeptide-type bacteriocin biosynthesis protein [uncultured Tenacibaculum sp.]
MKRNFILGDEWIYYKIYCGKRTADTVLTNIIKPLSEKLLKENLINQWFFIRYTDPKPHLRVRFHILDTDKVGNVIKIVKNHTEKHVNDGTICSIQTDMYSRELERYGYSIIEESEHLFYIDSETCLDALSLIDDDILLFLFSLRSIDTTLNAFYFDIDQKIKFTAYNRDLFKKEFNANKALSKQLNIKYQTLRNPILSFFTKPHKEFTPLVELLNKKSEEIKQKVRIINDNVKNQNLSIEDLLASHIHMTVNRIFRDKQRLHELVCYSCLYKFYQFQKNVIK